MSKLALEWQQPGILESVFDQLSDALLLYDKDKYVTGVNQAAEKLFGMTSDELVGRQCRDLFHCAECDAGCGILAGLGETQNVPSCTVRMHAANGRERLVIMRTTQIAGETGLLEGVVATKMAVDQQGRLTGRYEGKNCRGSEKFSRVTSWMRSEGLLGTSSQAPILWAYGNSRGDLRLLRAADFGVSCAKLGRASKLSGFPTLAEVVARSAAEQP